MGITNNGGVMEILTSKDGETWTLLITMPNGMACMMATGEDWINMTKPPGLLH